MGSNLERFTILPWWLPTLVAIAIGCDQPSARSPLDAGWDGGNDAGWDGGNDAGWDGGSDAGWDGGSDAGWDGGSDAGWDGGSDAAWDGGSDAGWDGGSDAGWDAGLVPRIVSPSDGSALTARRQVFAWTADGSNYRLRIGTTPGAADVFQSPPLGNATSVAVDGLPLTGVTLFVELSSGPDDARVYSTATYQAPMRRGLCVVVDYADVQLEDWSGLGMNDLTDVDMQLVQMEAHWDWLSRGREKTAWDVVRVRLATNLAETTFAGWSAFRDEVVRLTTQQVRIADYDVDSDGIIDGMWAIVSSQGTSPDYAIGGTSRNLSANIFVDGQASTSVVGQVTGNFNHEFAHTLGIQDLYGTYNTLSDLTLMSGSWPLPPNDFSAYERVRMGWVDPVLVTQSIAGVEVPSADAQLFALKIPTARSEEYFLVEYRKRPTSGYGSAGSFAYDGLAVYHVFEGSNQNTDPPLLKLEPADGTTAANYLPEITDLAFPENPGLLHPLVLRTYFGGDAVFAIDGLHWTLDGALAFDLTVLSTGMGSASNRIVNPTVEIDASSWSSAAWMPTQATFAWVQPGANGSGHSLSITSASENDAEWATHVTGLVPNGANFLCGYLQGQGVTGGAGATLSLSGTFVQTPGLHGTFDWTRRCIIVSTAGSSTDVACRMGGFGATTLGQMGCDDVTLVPLNSGFGAWP